jgi:hypothetical protein
MAERYMKRIDGQVTYWQFDHAEYNGPVSIRLVSLKDDTASDPIRYDSRCSSCYLGHAHSAAFHRASLGTLTVGMEAR